MAEGTDKPPRARTLLGSTSSHPAQRKTTDRRDDPADKQAGQPSETPGYQGLGRQIRSEPTSTARSPHLLLTVTVVLVVAGVVLLTMPPTPSAPAAPTTASRATGLTSVPSAAPPSSRPPQTGAPAPVPASTAAAEPTSALPPHGEGIAGDAAIQKSLEGAWPADLSADDEHKLLAAGRGLLRADATGIGRAKWPALFGDPDQAIAPAFATARFRIQAAIARRDGSPTKAVVHLVWAGTDRGGTYTDRRITDLFFTRTVKKGEPMWTPQPRI